MIRKWYPHHFSMKGRVWGLWGWVYTENRLEDGELGSWWKWGDLRKHPGHSGPHFQTDWRCLQSSFTSSPFGSQSLHTSLVWHPNWVTCYIHWEKTKASDDWFESEWHENKLEHVIKGSYFNPLAFSPITFPCMYLLNHIPDLLT